jgi:hypothetical protein
MRGHEFYLLCWCAGLLLGRGKDARTLLRKVKEENYPELYPDAVAQCIFEAATLPIARPPQAWEQLWPSIHQYVDDFLIALEERSMAPDLARRAWTRLKTMILKHSPTWQEIIEEYEQAVEKQKACLEELERGKAQLEKQRDEWQRLAEEREQTVEKQRAGIEELEQGNVLLEKERSHWQQIAEEREVMLAIQQEKLYFKQEDIRERKWWLRVAAGNLANLVFPPNNPEMVRIAIEKAKTKKRFDIQLNQSRLKVKSEHRYTVSFQARADSPRGIIVGFAQAHQPWTGLGLYRKIDLTSEWQSFEENFVATADEDNARIHFDVGGSNIAVEVSSVRLRSLLDGESIKPDLSPMQIGKPN